MSKTFDELSINYEINRNILKIEDSDAIGFFVKHIRSLSEDKKEFLISEINEYYFKKQWGLKIIARNVFDISYTNCRTMFNVLNIEFRKGQNVITDNLKQFRSEKALEEVVNKTGFQNNSVERFSKKTNRGVQGYYYNCSTNSYVWLRSTYEYIYAKFLNKIKANWKTEQNVFNLKDGTRYTPDFYLYDSDWKLTSIIEIKGYFDNRAYKINDLREEAFKNSDIELILVSDITRYLEEEKTYLRELRSWKKIRKSKECIANELQ